MNIAWFQLVPSRREYHAIRLVGDARLGTGWKIAYKNKWWIVYQCGEERRRFVGREAAEDWVLMQIREEYGD